MQLLAALVVGAIALQPVRQTALLQRAEPAANGTNGTNSTNGTDVATENATDEVDHPGQWWTGPWSGCNCTSGKMTREAKCLHGVKCRGKEPQTVARCNDRCQGHFTYSRWSACHGDCLREGYQSREGKCVFGDCMGLREKTEVRKCKFDSPRCHQCEVTVYGKSAWDGWSHTFLPGTYEERELRQRNLKCMDISSMKVYGFCCALRLYQYGDMNRRAGDPAHTWVAMYPEGNYAKEDLEAKGGFNDQASSLQIFIDKECVAMHKAIALRENGAVGLAALAALSAALLL